MKAYPTKGWPPDASPGEWLGWDAQGRLSILRWMQHKNFVQGIWAGVRFDPQFGMSAGERMLPLAFVRGADTENFVIRHRLAVGARGE